jgi:hypothetical protein
VLSKFAEYCSSSANSYIVKKFLIYLSPPHAFLLPLSSHLLLQAVQHRLLLQGGKGITAYQRFRGRFFIFLPSVYSEAWLVMIDSPTKPENNRRRNRAIGGQGNPIGPRTGRDVGGDLSVADIAGEEDGAGAASSHRSLKLVFFRRLWLQGIRESERETERNRYGERKWGGALMESERETERNKSASENGGQL